MKTQEDAVEVLRAREAAALEELVDFCMAQERGRCFPNWPAELVRAYLVFHTRQRTACYVRMARREPRPTGAGVRTSGLASARATGGNLIGMGVCWQVREEFVRRAEFARKPWLYHHNDADGECLFIDNLIATDRAAMGVLMSELQFRWPAWRRLKLFGKRRGVLVEYNPERIFARVEGIAL